MRRLWFGLAAVSLGIAAVAACVGEDPEPTRDPIIITVTPEAGGGSSSSSASSSSGASSSSSSSASSSSGGSSSSSSGAIDGGGIPKPLVHCGVQPECPSGEVCCFSLDAAQGTCSFPDECEPTTKQARLTCDDPTDCAPGELCCAVLPDAGPAGPFVYSSSCQKIQTGKCPGNRPILCMEDPNCAPAACGPRSDGGAIPRGFATCL